MASNTRGDLHKLLAAVLDARRTPLADASADDEQTKRGESELDKLPTHAELVRARERKERLAASAFGDIAAATEKRVNARNFGMTLQ